MIARASQLLRSVGLAVTIVAPAADRYCEWADRLVRDESPGLGPVEGLRAALAASDSDWVLALPVDMPHLQPEILRELLDRVEPGCAAVCFVEDSGRRHPFPGLYHRSIAERIVGEMPKGGSMNDLLDRVDAREIPIREIGGPIPVSFSFRNLNRPKEMEGDRDAGTIETREGDST